MACIPENDTERLKNEVAVERLVEAAGIAADFRQHAEYAGDVIFGLKEISLVTFWQQILEKCANCLRGNTTLFERNNG